LPFDKTRETAVQKIGYQGLWLETHEKHTGGSIIYFYWLAAPEILKFTGGPHKGHWWPQDFSPSFFPSSVKLSHNTTIGPLAYLSPQYTLPSLPACSNIGAAVTAEEVHRVRQLQGNG
jgi:hypothetical protein